MAFLTGTGKTPVVYRRLQRLDTPQDLAHLEAWRQAITKRVNVQTSQAATLAGGVLRFVEFIGTGVRVSWPLPGRVMEGTTPLVESQGLAQRPGVSFEILPLNDTQDQIHFLFTPRTDQVLMVYFQPAE